MATSTERPGSTGAGDAPTDPPTDPADAPEPVIRAYLYDPAGTLVVARVRRWI